MAANSKAWRRGKFPVFVVVCQVLFVVLFAILVEYAPSAEPDKHGSSHARRRRASNSSGEDDVIDHEHADNSGFTELAQFYPMFQDVHVMMLIGFGFLMTYVKRYGFTSVGVNFLICAFVIQWATLMHGFLHLHDNKIEISIETMLLSDFACAAVLISFGAVLGKVSPLQLMVMSLLEIAVFQANEYVGLKHFEVVDVGGSMFVHVFGAYFGMVVARILYTDDLETEEVQNKSESVYHSDLFSMIGTLFLWMFWPSFNGAVALPGDAQHRAVLNTYFALCAGTVVAFALCSALDENDKFEMEYIQNATLAAGVAVGTFADMDVGAWGAMLTGMVAGAVSVLGYKFLTPFLARRKFVDTCGVHNLHGMPGIIAALGGIVVAYMADDDKYGQSLYQLFPARAPESKAKILADPERYGDAKTGEGWSAGEQAGMQAAALGLTIATAVAGGIVTGLILKLPIWNQPQGDDVFEDATFWHIPAEGYPNVYVGGKPLRRRRSDEDDDMITSRGANNSIGVDEEKTRV